jgi:hypothetical protein
MHLTSSELFTTVKCTARKMEVPTTVHLTITSLGLANNIRFCSNVMAFLDLLAAVLSLALDFFRVGTLLWNYWVFRLCPSSGF